MARLKKKDYDNINNRINNNNDHNNGDSNNDYADHNNEYTQIKKGKKKEDKTWVDYFFAFCLESGAKFKSWRPYWVHREQTAVNVNCKGPFIFETI